MKYFLATFTQIEGMPKEELVHFVIKAETLEDAKNFVETDNYFFEIIGSTYPTIKVENVNVVIFPLEKLNLIYNNLNNAGDEMSACVLNDEHTHLTTVENKGET
jgi:hypothetical protein